MPDSLTTSTSTATVAVAVTSAALLLGTITYFYPSGATPSLTHSSNPFSHDTREPAKCFESDQKKRDAVLKNGYTAKKYEESVKGVEYDAIVIGSGE
jgi:hypothetical protein